MSEGFIRKAPHSSPSPPFSESFVPVLVVGGGAGGCAAALAVAEHGQRVILTEAGEWLGGQLTAQLTPPDEHGWIEQCGCTRTYRRFRDGVRQYYRLHYPLLPEFRDDPLLNPGGGTVSRVCYEPRVGLAVLYEMLARHLAAGRIQILTRHRPLAASTTGDRVESVAFLDERSGQQRVIHAQYVIDATELGDLLPLAKVEYVSGAESQADTGEPHAAPVANPDDVQAWTWCVAVSYDPATPPDSDRYRISPPASYKFWREFVPPLTPPWPGPLFSWTTTDPITRQPVQRAFLPSERRGERFCWWRYRQLIGADRYPADSGIPDTTSINWPQNDFFLGNMIDRPAKEVERLLAASKELTLSLVYWIQTEAPRRDGGVGYGNIYPRPDLTGCEYGLAPAPYIRESRRIRGLFTVTENHIGVEARGGKPAEKFPDSVGVGCYRIDLHPSAAGSNYLDLDASRFQIPLGALIPRRVRNLLAGAKNLSVTHIANGAYRLHPVEWNVGEAAGRLAAFCLARHVEPHQVHGNPTLRAEFQSMLENAGVELDWPDPK